jgi:hypothetical protein
MKQYEKKGRGSDLMGAVFSVVVIVFVVGVVGLVGFALFEVTPLARHQDHYRDPVTGARRMKSPNLED